MGQKRRSGLGDSAAAKKTKAADGAVPKYLVVNNYERRSTVRTALSKVVKQAPWRDLFRLLSKRMTCLTWTASRAFNHFVLRNVISDRVPIPNDQTLFNILRMCFTVGTSGPLASNSKLSKDPVVVEWVASWRALNDDWPSVDKAGMGNVITHAATQYNTAVGNYLRSGLRDLYVRTLKDLGCDYHKDVALRVLATHVAKRTKNFSFSLDDNDAYQARITKRDPSVEAAIQQRVEAEVDLMGPLSTYNDAFRFLHRLRARLEQDYARRRLAKSDAYPPHHFSIAPLTGMKPCFVRIDNTTVRLLYKEHVSVNTIDLATPRGIGDVVAVPTRKGFELGGSILTDGTQVLTTCAKRWSQTDFVSEKQFAKHVEMQQKRATRIAAYEKQQARRSSGEAAEGDVERIHWKSVAPSYKTDTTHIQPREGPFHACTHGIFDRSSAHATHQVFAGGALPTVFGLDPGVKNLWNIVQYDEAASRTPSEAKRVLNKKPRAGGVQPLDQVQCIQGLVGEGREQTSVRGGQRGADAELAQSHGPRTL